MNGNRTIPMERASGGSDSRLPDILSLAAVGVFVIVELIGTQFYEWNGGSLLHMSVRQWHYLFVLGALVYFPTYALGRWIASWRWTSQAAGIRR